MNRALYTGTYLYLTLPYVFFLSGWLRAEYAVPAVVLLVLATAVAIRQVFRRFNANEEDRQTRPRAIEYLGLLVPICIAMSLSGTGGWGYQDADWLKGNAVMLDLVDEPWPVVYQTPTGSLVLVYYFAFYLPAAWVGKIAGWPAANHTLFVYGLMGLSLAGIWIVRLSGVRRWWATALFLMFSGMDVIGKLIRYVGETAANIQHQGWESLEWWAGYGVVAFPSYLDMLVNTAMQTIPGWLLGALVLSDARAQRLLGTCLFYLGVSTLWAPFVSIGLLPLVAVLVLPELRRRGWTELASWPNALGVLLALVSAGYYSMRVWPYTLPMDLSHLYQEHFTLTLFRLGPLFLGIYPLFVFLEFGLLHALIYVYARLRGPSPLLDSTLRRSLIASSVVLVVLPWLNEGWNNDLVLRACVPALFVTTIVVLRVLDDRPPHGRRLRLVTVGIVGVIAIGALSAGWVLAKQVRRTYARGALVAVPRREDVHSLFQVQQERYNRIGFNFVAQYMGSPESPFAKYIMSDSTKPAP